MTVYRHQGKWMYDFWKNGRRQKRSGFPTKEQAKIAESEARRNLRQINTDFISLCEKRLDDIQIRRSKKYYTDNYAVIKHILKEWGRKKAIKRVDVEELLNKIAKENPKNANKYLKLIKAIFNFGIQRELTSFNPANNIPKYPSDPIERYVPPIDDIRKVIQLATPEQRNYLIATINSAGRIGAINNLKWEDINLTERYLILHTRKAKNSDKKEIKIFIGDQLFETLQSIEHKSEYVFINSRTGKPYDYRDKFLKTLCKKAGVKEFTFHCFRHWGASQLYKKGVPLEKIQQYLGHERATTTDRYIHQFVNDLHEESRLLEV